MMNFLLVSDKENAGKCVVSHSCYYCKKVFSSHQALGVHREETQAVKCWNYHGCSSSFIKTYSIRRWNYLSPVPNRARSPYFSNRFWSTRNAQLNVSQVFQNSLGNIKTQFIPIPTLSSGIFGAVVPAPKSLSPTSCTPSWSHVTTISSSAISKHLDSDGVFLKNSDQFGTCLDGALLYPMSRGTPLYHGSASGNPYLGLGSIKISGSCEYTTTDLFSPGLDKVEVIQCNESGVLTYERGKRPCFRDLSGRGDALNVFKRHKIHPEASFEGYSWDKKEPSLIQNLEGFSYESETSCQTKEEDVADLDLSLHL